MFGIIDNSSTTSKKRHSFASTNLLKAKLQSLSHKWPRHPAVDGRPGCSFTYYSMPIGCDLFTFQAYDLQESRLFMVAMIPAVALNHQAEVVLASTRFAVSSRGTGPC